MALRFIMCCMPPTIPMPPTEFIEARTLLRVPVLPSCDAPKSSRMDPRPTPPTPAGATPADSAVPWLILCWSCCC